MKLKENLLNEKYFGKEPIKLSSSVKLLDAYNYYNNVCDVNDAKKYLITYLVNNNRKEEARLLNNLKMCWIPLVSGWIARIINNGNIVPEETISFMNKKLTEALSHRTEDEAETRQTIQSFIKDKSNDVIADIEDMIDNGYDMTFSYYNYFKAKEYSPNVLKKVQEYYKPLADEYREIPVDRQLKEAYSNLTKKEITNRLTYFDKMLSDIDTLISNKKKARKPPTRKVKTKKVNLIDFKYQKEDLENKLVSLSPEKLLDKREAWLYNTKMNTLTVLYSDTGFTIKGTTIQNISEKSTTKKIGKSSKKVLTSVLENSKVQIRKLMETISTSAITASGRTNENVIILRVF